MAVRWGAGEETFSTCNMDIFPLETRNETTGLHSDATFDTFQGCLDPAILSIFEETPAIGTRDFGEDTEATLLTALTEILDNVNDENLSPFDTLPESDLLSGHKGRDHSPLGRLFCTSLSLPENEVMFGKSRSSGKMLPIVPQQSDGEEEESLILSPGGLPLSSDNELLDWEELPVILEQHADDGLAVNLGDLVRQMHPYCMAISLEDDDGERMLPEGGILLEVVDQSENGHPILAIPGVDQSIDKATSKTLDEAAECSSDTSEHIIVDDDEDFVNPQVNNEENMTKRKDLISRDVHFNDNNLKSRNTSRKSKKCNGPASCPSQTYEGRVLRSSSLKKASHKKKLVKQSSKSVKKGDRNTPLDLKATNTFPLFTKPKVCESSGSTTAATVHQIPMSSNGVEKDKSESLPKEECTQSYDSKCISAASASEEESAVVNKGEPLPSSDQPLSIELTHTIASVRNPAPPAVIAEPKPKALSLAEYRRLRQQKKPAPVEKNDDNSTKWPSLPETPKELPLIPYLPEPNPRDPRRSRPQSKEEEEVKPAWMPRGPCAPPTPEALLAPPAYMVNSAVNKVSAVAVPKPPQSISEVAPSQHSNHQNTSAAALHTKETTTEFSQTCSKTTVAACELKPADASTPLSSDAAAASPETKVSMNSTQKQHNPSCNQASSPANLVEMPNQRTTVESENAPAVKPLPPKSPTQKLIEAFTTEMGIEAADLTSLLEQFEETQAKEKQCVPEVSGRAVAVGNSSSVRCSEKKSVDRVKASDLSSTALTPPATPPHPTWKPLVPTMLLGKTKTTEAKAGLSKVVETEAKPLLSTKVQSKFTLATSFVAPDQACKDHDYCLPNKGSSNGEAGKRWNVKSNSSITIKPLKQPVKPVQHNIQVTSVKPPTCTAKTQQIHIKDNDLNESSVLETPDASPTRDVEPNSLKCLKQAPLERSYRQRAISRSPSPERRSLGRSRVRRSRRSESSRSSSSESDSSRSRSRSYTPPKKRYRRHRSRSSSLERSQSGSSRSSRSRSPSRSPCRRRRYSYTSSRSASWSSRSRSRTPQWSRKRNLCSPTYREMYGANVKNQELKRRKEKAIEERRVVYVGRIHGTMTQTELKERFLYFGEIEECTLHFRDHGDNYGFVTYYNTDDAFMAIENGSKLRKPDELPFDLCFGGRRQFCQTSYADLDYNAVPSRNKTLALDFDTLLKQAQQNMKR